MTVSPMARVALGLKDVVRTISDSRHHLVLTHRLLLLGQPALLDHKRVKVQLLHRPVQDLLLDRVLGDEPEDLDRLGLADPVRPVLRLQIHLRVPVRVVQH